MRKLKRRDPLGSQFFNHSRHMRNRLISPEDIYSKEQRLVDPARMEGLTDGVFAIVLTLVVLDIHLGGHNANFVQGVYRLWPEFVGYVVSFVALSMLWISIRSQYHFIKRMNFNLMWIALFFLGFVALLPFTVSVATRYINNFYSVFILSANMIICCLMLLLHWVYILKYKDELKEDHLDTMTMVMLSFYPVVAIFFYVVSIIVGIFDPPIAFILYFAIPVVMILSPKLFATFGAKIHNRIVTQKREEKEINLFD